MATEVPKIVTIPSFEDARGKLFFAETSKNIGFAARRFYYIYPAKSEDLSRGYHSHRKLQQLVICMQGSVCFKVEGQSGVQEFVLNDPAQGLFIPPHHWREFRDFSADAIIAVLASEEYDEDDYIRDYNQFKKELPEKENGAA